MFKNILIFIFVYFISLGGGTRVSGFSSYLNLQDSRISISHKKINKLKNRECKIVSRNSSRFEKFIKDNCNIFNLVLWLLKPLTTNHFNIKHSTKQRCLTQLQHLRQRGTRCIYETIKTSPRRSTISNIHRPQIVDIMHLTNEQTAAPQQRRHLDFITQ